MKPLILKYLNAFIVYESRTAEWHLFGTRDIFESLNEARCYLDALTYGTCYSAQPQVAAARISAALDAEAGHE